MKALIITTLLVSTFVFGQDERGTPYIPSGEQSLSNVPDSLPYINQSFTGEILYNNPPHTHKTIDLEVDSTGNMAINFEFITEDIEWVDSFFVTRPDTSCYLKPYATKEYRDGWQRDVRQFEFVIPITHSGYYHVDSIYFKKEITGGEIVHLTSVSFSHAYNFIYLKRDTITEDSLHTNTLTLYPNPTSRQLQLKLDKPCSGKIVIYSSTGQLVYQEEAFYEELNFTLNVSEFTKGNYILVFTDRDTKTVHRKKFMIN